MELKMDIPALEAFLAQAFPQADDAVTVERLTDDGLVARLHVGAQHLRPGGTVSGPAMFMLTDVAVYLAILARIGPVALAVTTSCSMDFMRKPAADVDMLCHASLLKLGRTLAVCDVLLYSEGQAAPVARATMTYGIPQDQHD